MSEKTAELPIREKADYYVSDVNELIGKLTQRPPEDFLNMQANTGLLNRYKSWKEKLFNLKEPRNPDGKYLNANERRVIEVAYNELRKLVDEDLEGAALSAEMARAGPYVFTMNPGDWDEKENAGHRHGWTPAIRESQKQAEIFKNEKLAAETKSDLPPPPPYTPKGGKRKTRRRRKLKKRKTMKKKKLRRKKTMKKRKSRKRRKTKKRRSKRR